MSFRGKEIMSFETRIKLTKVCSLMLVMLIGVMMFGNVVYADAGTFGENSYNWLGGQVFYLALLMVVVIAIPFIAKKMWMQLVGFLVLASLILVIVKDPQKVKTLGEIIWQKILG
jgi:hypothetical protein